MNERMIKIKITEYQIQRTENKSIKYKNKNKNTINAKNAKRNKINELLCLLYERERTRERMNE